MAMNRCIQTKKLKQQGMTLLEVLVAMTLMVIISAISYASLNGLIDAKIHTDKVANNLRKEVLFSQQLSKDVHAIIKRPVKDQYASSQAAIVGDYNGIQFSRNGYGNPLKQNRAELQRVHWFVRQKQLFRRSIAQLDSGSFPKWQERLYLSDVTEFDVRYVSASGQELRRWPLPENPRLPLRMIKFHLEFTDGTSLNYILSPGMLNQ